PPPRGRTPTPPPTPTRSLLAPPRPRAGQARPGARAAPPSLHPGRARRPAFPPPPPQGPHPRRSRPPPRGLPRPPPSRVVPADVAEESHLRRGGAGLPLVARHRRALVGAAPTHPQAHGARLPLEGAARERSEEHTSELQSLTN